MAPVVAYQLALNRKLCEIGDGIKYNLKQHTRLRNVDTLKPPSLEFTSYFIFLAKWGCKKLNILNIKTDPVP